MIENTRIHTQQPLISPETLINEYPLSADAAASILSARETIAKILTGQDPRLLVIVGPCSIHDPKAALEYADLLQKAAQQFSEKLFIVMRVYFEKPRTTFGWKGLISDPFLNGTPNFNHGLKLARKLLLEINAKGLPAATEFLDPIIPQYLGDLISWCAIGARTSESQLHRELASGLAMPVGFKNSTDGNIQIAIDAVQVAAQPHYYLSINNHGLPMMMTTSGNHAAHIVLRGSNSGPNFSREHVQHALKLLSNAKLNPHLIIDCSHGNSMKNHELQSKALQDIITQLQNHSSGICGIMIESNLIAGKQALNNNLVYGQSITDACIGWNETFSLLSSLSFTTL